MPKSKRQLHIDAALSAIGREWNAFYEKQGKPIRGASAGDGLDFCSYLLAERPNRLDFPCRTNDKWQTILAYLSRTGRVIGKRKTDGLPSGVKSDEGPALSHGLIRPVRRQADTHRDEPWTPINRAVVTHQSKGQNFFCAPLELGFCRSHVVFRLAAPFSQPPAFRHR